MNIKLHYIIFLFCAVGFFSCKKDNYSAPSSTLNGRLVYKGETFGVEKDQVPFELYQYGFGKVGPIGQSFAQDGTYSAILFDGDYKLIVPNNQGPFMWKKTASGAPDSLSVTMKGSQVLDLEVTPYYIFKTPAIVATAGSAVATFSLEKVITDAVNGKGIDEVTLYVNKSQFTSAGNREAEVSIPGSALTNLNNIRISAVIPAVTPTQNYMYARVGLKISGIEDRIFSPLVRLTY